jgi:hypothetical protein
MSKIKRARYQFYLDKKVAGRLAKIGQEVGISRSQLIRDAASSVVDLYSAKRPQTEKPDYNLLFKFSGIINIPATNLSARVDDIYIIDEFRHQHGVS